MSTDLLRRAAAVLRERAEKATTGPWFAAPREDDAGMFVWTNISDTDFEVACTDTGAEEDGENADYIATLHPGVGLLLADWLDHMAWLEAGAVNAGRRVRPGTLPPHAVKVAAAILVAVDQDGAR